MVEHKPYDVAIVSFKTLLNKDYNDIASGDPIVRTPEEEKELLIKHATASYAVGRCGCGEIAYQISGVGPFIHCTKEEVEKLALEDS